MSLLLSTSTEQLPTLNSARNLEKQGKVNQEDRKGGRMSALPPRASIYLLELRRRQGVLDLFRSLWQGFP